MPEYLAPGVYVEEVSFRSKSIEGVSTTTTGFIGPARYGPVDLEPDIITSLGEFERVYGDRQQLNFSDAGRMHNYLWHAVRAFFEEGGKRLYIARVFREQGGQGGDGFARARVPANAAQAGQPNDPLETRFPGALHISARFPGEPGNMRLRITLRLGQNILAGDPVEGQPGTLRPRLSSIMENDIVWIADITSPIGSPPGSGTLFRVQSDIDPVTNEPTWTFVDAGGAELRLSSLSPDLDPNRGDQVRVVTITVTVPPSDINGFTQVWDAVPPDPDHQQAGLPDGLSRKFGLRPSNLAQARTLPIVVRLGDNITDGLDVLGALFNESATLRGALDRADSTDAERSIDIDLEGGNDGRRPSAALEIDVNRPFGIGRVSAIERASQSCALVE